MTNCMPPTSSKKRSNTIVSYVGRQPSAACPAARYSRSCSAAGSAIPTSSASQRRIPSACSPPRKRAAISARRRDTAADNSSLRPGASPSQNGMVGAIPWASSTRATPAAAGAEAVRQHAHHRREILPRQRAIGRGTAHERIEFVLVPFARGHFGDDLLRQHIERLLRDREAVELAAADAVEQRRALHQLIAR